MIVEIECELNDVIIPFCSSDVFKEEWLELNHDIERDGMWFMVLQGMFLFIICKCNYICVSGLSSSEGPRSFSYDLSSDKEGMLMNSQCFKVFTFVMICFIGDSEVCYLSSALKVNSSLTVLNLGVI